MKWLLTAVLLTSMAAFAGDKGNGGDGIEIDGKLYVLDLVEAGIENDVKIDLSLHVGGTTQSRIEETFHSAFPRKMIGAKIAEIQFYAPLFADALLRAMESYQWRLVNGALVNIKDENTVLQYENLKQLAVRKNTSIFINKSLWEQLDEGNKTALIFHEILYALIKPKMIAGEMQQVSDRAREVVGYLFESSSTDIGRLYGLKKVLRSDYFDKAASEMANSIRVRGAGGDTMFEPKVIAEVNGKKFSFGVSEYIPKPSDFQVEEICQAAKGSQIRIVDAASEMIVELKEFSTEDGTRNYVEVRTKDLDLGSSTTISVTMSTTVEPKKDVWECIHQVSPILNAKIDEVSAAYLNWEEN